MLNENQPKTFKNRARTIERAKAEDEELGPLKLLPGTWKSLPGRGWNMIALPFATEPSSRLNYRLLLNQFHETIKFTLVDKTIPNRGIQRNEVTVDSDQFLAALDYEQMISQIAADDFPQSGKAGNPNLAIHHEPGLWLHVANQTINALDLGRLATIPHVDTVLALGTSSETNDAPSIRDIKGSE